ncbi:prevent-host-death family protein [Nocardia sp. CA-128927]|uniref:prevent-host-death family protein n=1 Tax=Nocardia sp. CA-128927 TaxID=3239975 RepID=UPI003D98FFCC
MDTDSDEQPIAVARANLSELINNVRLLHRMYFLTSRDKRQAAVVPVELGELVQRAGGTDAAVRILADYLAGDDR